MTKLGHYNLVLSCIFLFSTQLHQVLSIECYYCHSQASWEDCHNGLKKGNCSAVPVPGLDICLKQYIIKPGANNTQIVDYVKMCAQSGECEKIKKDCKERGFYCEAYCCNTDLCNTSGRPMVSGIFYVTGVLYWFYLRVYYG